jgi:ATP synthase I subunit
VLVSSAVGTAALAVPAAVLGGGPGALGVVAGGGLGTLNFWWLAARAAAACEVLAGGRSSATWLIATGIRLAVVGVLCALLLLTGWIHPVGLLVGLTVVPGAAVAQGLRAVGEVS